MKLETNSSGGWEIPMPYILASGERHSQAYAPNAPFEVRKNNLDLHEHVLFYFWLGGALWTERAKQPAFRYK
jgi:hypothetical protein